MQQISVIVFIPYNWIHLLVVISNSFLVEFLEFFVYKVMPSANSDSFVSSFPVWVFFIFSCSSAETKRWALTELLDQLLPFHEAPCG